MGSGSFQHVTPFWKGPALESRSRCWGHGRGRAAAPGQRPRVSLKFIKCLSPITESWRLPPTCRCPTHTNVPALSVGTSQDPLPAFPKEGERHVITTDMGALPQLSWDWPVFFELKPIFQWGVGISSECVHFLQLRDLVTPSDFKRKRVLTIR